MVDLAEITLENLAGGALAEHVAHELAKVLANIADPNTDAEANRELRIVVVFQPAADRESANTIVKVTSKLAGLKPVASPIWLGMKNGRPVAVGRDLRQKDMFEGDGGIVPMKRPANQEG